MPSRTATIELDENSAAFLDAQLRQGRFSDASAVLQAGIPIVRVLHESPDFHRHL